MNRRQTPLEKTRAELPDGKEIQLTKRKIVKLPDGKEIDHVSTKPLYAKFHVERDPGNLQKFLLENDGSPKLGKFIKWQTLSADVVEEINSHWRESGVYWAPLKEEEIEEEAIVDKPGNNQLEANSLTSFQVNSLKKAELEKLLSENDLSTEGSVLELKKRLIEFYKQKKSE